MAPRATSRSSNHARHDNRPLDGYVAMLRSLVPAIVLAAVAVAVLVVGLLIESVALIALGAAIALALLASAYWLGKEG